MKQFFSLKVLTMIFAALSLFTSCNSNDDPKNDADAGSKVTLPASRVYVLNEGIEKLNNANLSLYNPDNGEPSFINDIFNVQNGMNLGDIGQDMIEHKGNLYISVFGSNYIAKTNAAGVLQGRLLFSSNPELQGGVRYLAEANGYIYASFHGGAIVKITTGNGEIVSKITGLGANLEGMAVLGNNLYVCNSYQEIYNPTTGYNDFKYFTDVFVIDLTTFTHKQTIKVEQNPNRILAANGKLFVISWNYDEPSYVLQMIDPAANNAVTKLGYATHMAAVNGTLYLADCRNDYSQWPKVLTKNSFAAYNIATGKMESTFLTDAPEGLYSTAVQGMGTDPTTGDIYIGVCDYTTTGDVYRATKDGKYITSFSSAGYCPRAFAFF